MPEYLEVLRTMHEGFQECDFDVPPFREYVNKVRFLRKRPTGGMVLREKSNFPDDWLVFDGYCPGSMPKKKSVFYSFFNEALQHHYTSIIVFSEHDLTNRICEWLDFEKVQNQSNLFVYTRG